MASSQRDTASLHLPHPTETRRGRQREIKRDLSLTEEDTVLRSTSMRSVRDVTANPSGSRGLQQITWSSVEPSRASSAHYCRRAGGAVHLLEVWLDQVVLFISWSCEDQVVLFISWSCEDQVVLSISWSCEDQVVLSISWRCEDQVVLSISWRCEDQVVLFISWRCGGAVHLLEVWWDQVVLFISWRCEDQVVLFISWRCGGAVHLLEVWWDQVVLSISWRSGGTRAVDMMLSPWDSWYSSSCCLCCHVRTGTIILGVWYMLINAVVLIILFTALSDPEQYHLTSAELANDLDVMDDANMCIASAISVLMILICGMATYGAYKLHAAWLLPFFGYQIFDFGLNTLVAVSIVVYPNTIQDYLQQLPDNFPYKEEVAALSSLCLLLVVLLFISCILAFKAYLIACVWNCYRYVSGRGGSEVPLYVTTNDTTVRPGPGPGPGTGPDGGPCPFVPQQPSWFYLKDLLVRLPIATN
ncbi:Lysosomal-associated transmembrane protein 4B [Merluccius polli]|uniref:Lysosomal-associated transmembrane protein 4B n=1 Tax=Merluccius polli TaxID=89951 RepID=A0AA47M1F3_MERPO|nr:Lysosomal-associated transmembrane protein 4B [Merluccius polli]